MSKTVLLYSGGLDSYALSRLYKYDVALFFKIGTDDNDRELEYIYERREKSFLEKLQVVDMPLVNFELENYVIPFRNHIFVLLAANYGNRILFGSTSGDFTKDTDCVFKAQTEGILNYFSMDSHKVKHQYYPYEVVMPFRQINKYEILKRLLKVDTAENVKRMTRSCHVGGEEECGDCPSCYRTYQAYTLNGLDFSVNINGYKKYLLETNGGLDKPVEVSGE